MKIIVPPGDYKRIVEKYPHLKDTFVPYQPIKEPRED
jgi:hypothetical protein